MSAAKRWIPKDLVAERISVHPDTVDNLVARRQIIAPIRIGRNVRWDSILLDRWLEAGAPPLDQFEDALN